jgi:hypothetical protein
MKRTSRFQSSQTIAITFGVLVSITCLVAPNVHAQVDPVVYSAVNFSGRLIEVTRLGNNQGMNDEITILELVEPDERIRVLHQLTTICPYYLSGSSHSSCGRFVITMGERLGTGISERELVIYDLVRQEHTAYGIQDFLPAETIASLELSGIRSGESLRWQSSPGFDLDRMEFYPSCTSECRKANLPFVVIDLLSRKVRVEPIPDRKILPLSGQGIFFHPSLVPEWRCSAGDQPLPAPNVPLKLPPYLRVEYGPKDKRGRQVFRLDNQSGDYLAVAEAKWPDSRLPLIRESMYGSNRVKLPLINGH